MGGMTSPAIPIGQVTAADLMGEVSAARRDIQGVLTRVEVMDTRHGTVSAHVADLELRMRVVEAAMPESLKSRLGQLERWQWKAAGAMAAVAIVVGLLAGWIGTLLGRLH